MSIIDIGLKRRRRERAPESAHIYRPQVEALEARDCPAVAAPTGVQLAALSPSQVKITWNDVANETGYRVFRWNGTQSVLLGTLGQNVKTFTAVNLQPNQVQWFTVQAFNVGATATSAWASIKTPAEAITAPTNVRVGSSTLTSITLNWNDSTGETGYRIYNWDGTRATQVGAVAANATAFTVQNLSPGLNYYFYVQAFNNTNAASSDWVNGATKSFTLTAPTNTKATIAGPTTIGLSWTDASAEVGYRVYGWNGNSNTSPVLLATLAANTTGYQATGLLPGKTYWFYVQAFNSQNFANSPWVSATTPVALPLQPVTQLDVDHAGPGSVLVSWTEPARATGYRVYVWTGFNWIPASAIVPRGTHSAQINGLLTNRTQWFMVQAFTDNFAEIAYSNAVFINL